MPLLLFGKELSTNHLYGLLAAVLHRGDLDVQALKRSSAYLASQVHILHRCDVIHIDVVHGSRSILLLGNRENETSSGRLAKRGG